MPPSPEVAEHGQLRSDRQGHDGDRGEEGGGRERSHKHKSRKHKSHKHKSRKHKDHDKDSLRRRREAGSESPESGEIVPADAGEPGPQSKRPDADVTHATNGLDGTPGSDRKKRRSSTGEEETGSKGRPHGDAVAARDLPLPTEAIARDPVDEKVDASPGAAAAEPSQASDPTKQRSNDRERSRSRGSGRGDEARDASRSRGHRRDNGSHPLDHAHDRHRERDRDRDRAYYSERERDADPSRHDDSRRRRSRDRDGGDDRLRDVARRSRDDSHAWDRDADRDRHVRRHASLDGRGRQGSPDGRQRRQRERSRKRSRSREAGGRRGGSRDKHPRSDDRGGGMRGSRRSARDESPADDDEDPLLGVDPDEEEQRQIEERRRRLAEIKAKQQHAEDIAAPTASAMVRDSACDAPAEPGNSGAPAAATPPLPGGGGAGAGVHGADGGDGDVTPEGDRESDSDSDGGGRGGPVLEIFGDEATSGAAGHDVGADEPGAGAGLPGDMTGTSTGVERLRAMEVRMAGVCGPAAPAAAAAAPAPRKVVPATPAAAAPAASGDGSEDDMFAEEVAVDKLVAGGGGGGGAPAPAAALADAFDDHEGYYNFVVGEVMDGRYEVFAHNGKGVFSSVVRARDTARRDEAGKHPEVAIKLIRSNETMYKAAQTEVHVLRLLGASDPDSHKHCIKLQRTFEYRNHFCLVFEAMEMNLRDLTKKYGRNRGLDIKAVQLFACQLLIALRHLKKNAVLHADIKPDNILINHRHNKVKLCDFGSAMMHTGDNDVTPYLVSRFYRAPEVILGLKYDFGMDMWSIGCVVYELYTGRILFPGHSNNEMLKFMMETKGAFTKKMLRKAAFLDKHFENDQNMSFASLEQDPITKTQVRRLIAAPAAKSPFSVLIGRHSAAVKDPKDRALVGHLVDLLDRMMALEPDKRIDPDAALKHPFVREVLPKRKEAKAHK